jgi:hypothetical protein
MGIALNEIEEPESVCKSHGSTSSATFVFWISRMAMPTTNMAFATAGISTLGPVVWKIVMN